MFTACRRNYLVATLSQTLQPERTSIMLRFVEEIILLLLRDEDGRFVRIPSWSFDYAIAGGVLMDLAMEDRIDTDLETLILVDDTPLGDNLLDPTLADIAAENCGTPDTGSSARPSGLTQSVRKPSPGSKNAGFWSAKTTSSSGSSAPDATR